MRGFFSVEASELVLTEKLPLSFFALPDGGRPGARLHVERVTICQRAVVKGEVEFQGIGFLVTGSKTIGRVGAAVNVAPMHDVAISDAVESNQDDGFVMGRRCDIAIVKLDKVMLQHPLTVHSVA